ncbi:MAG: hypothetical protein GY899_00080 [Verrucomicrobiaceae bacterium]|nr:hypothetical protein [Verrucomicrobiaceae bacterium]
MKSIDLSRRAKFRLSGSDRVRYLNGQVSNDVTKAAGDCAISACVTTVKGGLEGLVWISVEAGGQAFLIDADAELRESLFERLSRYIIADDVRLEDITGDYLLIHDLGKRIAGIASERFALPGNDRWIRPGALPAGADWMSASAAEALRVEGGIPGWGNELTLGTLPAEASLELRSVDFHKGCYVGQEIISRLQSVGRVNRRLVALAFSGSRPQPGWLLLDVAGEKAGEVTSVVESSDGFLIGLGYVKRDMTVELAVSGGQDRSCSATTRTSAFQGEFTGQQ